ncbi:MAG: DNA gyrase inhibitor YacG [Lamprobacter sp.]|uniref:DNA gyrase inhibitor YacG n=1 Tax=Lamprobacter sp. TaxID=3100796 RepID=UPI002B2640B3|nr:DNA gyrase inhibitor YacG [Lamprobacter sp.]MEA3640128.1 DNA gyrase inhibitor YacG [Lamprobacter sp.]
MPMAVACPTCGKQVIWEPDSRWRPFCSKRCKLIDLGDWLDETHRISESLDSADGGADAEHWPSLDEGDVEPRH